MCYLGNHSLDHILITDCQRKKRFTLQDADTQTYKIVSQQFKNFQY